MLDGCCIVGGNSSFKLLAAYGSAQSKVWNGFYGPVRLQMGDANNCAIPPCCCFILEEKSGDVKFTTTHVGPTLQMPNFRTHLASISVGVSAWLQFREGQKRSRMSMADLPSENERDLPGPPRSSQRHHHKASIYHVVDSDDQRY